MSTKVFVIAGLMAVIAGPSFAQSAQMQSGSPQGSSPRAAYDQEGRSSDTMRSPDKPSPITTRQLNTASDNYTRHRVRAREQYNMDRLAYIAAIRAQHRRAVNRYDRRYIRQQNAYADAMAAWRRQVAACHRGNRHACAAPTPRVADFYYRGRD